MRTNGIPRFISNGKRLSPGIRLVDFREDGTTRVMTDDDERHTDEWTEIFFDTGHTCEELDDPAIPTPPPNTEAPPPNDPPMGRDVALKFRVET